MLFFVVSWIIGRSVWENWYIYKIIVIIFDFVVCYNSVGSNLSDLQLTDYLFYNFLDVMQISKYCARFLIINRRLLSHLKCLYHFFFKYKYCNLFYNLNLSECLIRTSLKLLFCIQWLITIAYRCNLNYPMHLNFLTYNPQQWPIQWCEICWLFIILSSYLKIDIIFLKLSSYIVLNLINML